MRDVLPALREANKNPNEMMNLETTAKGYIDWWITGSRPARTRGLFSKRVRG